MAQVLSQDEVDALFSAVNEDSDDELDNDFDDEYEDDDADQNIQPYDLTNQDRVIRGRMPILRNYL
jgi:flagellar motor switch protein FliM